MDSLQLNYILFIIGGSIPIAFIGTIMVAFKSHWFGKAMWLTALLEVLAVIGSELSFVTPSLSTLLALLIVSIVYLIRKPRKNA